MPGNTLAFLRFKDRGSNRCKNFDTNWLVWRNEVRDSVLHFPGASSKSDQKCESHNLALRALIGTEIALVICLGYRERINHTGKVYAESAGE